MAVYVPNPDAGPVDDLIEQLAAEVASRYAEAEDDIIRLLKRYAERELEAPLGLIERQTALIHLRAEAQRIVSSIRGTDLARQVVAIAADEGTAAAAARLGLVPQLQPGSTLGETAASAVAQLTFDLTSALDRMEQRILRYAPDAYQRIIAVTAPSTLLGVTTLEQSKRRATQMILDAGIPGFRDSAGRNWKPGTYAEMATRTATQRAWQESNLDRLARSGVNLVAIIAGVSACKACAAWTGKVLSADGSLPAGVHYLKSATSSDLVPVTVAGTLGDARAAGWNHPNCRCVVVGVFPGLSIPAGSTYDPQAEEDRDRLRALERRVRDLKRREAAALDDLTAAQLRRRIRTAQADIRAHVADTGQMRKNYREQLSFSDGSPRTQRALPALRAIT